jgi:hypothetical protein
MKTTTFETITREQIASLRTEAATAGDTEQVALCDCAAVMLSSPGRGHRNHPSVLACVAAIRDAEAQAEDDEIDEPDCSLGEATPRY